MDLDFRKRCTVVRLTPILHQVIIYGMTASEWDELEAVDVRDKYDHSNGHGRRPGRPVELEKTQHFFNRRIL